MSLTGSVLEEGGHDVLLAANGKEGLAIAENENPQIILCDVRMPQMDGLEFLKRFSEAEGQALVIVMTAYGNMELAVEAMKSGAYDYLPKPFGADEVLLRSERPRRGSSFGPKSGVSARRSARKGESGTSSLARPP